MNTITIDIINDKAVNLLEDMELLHLIRLHKNKVEEGSNPIDWTKYKGAMTKQPISEVDKQLKELRNGWE